MGRGSSSDPAALARARTAIGAGLRARRAELEQTALVKIGEVPDPPVRDPEYVVGLRGAVAAALECGLGVLEGRDPHSAPIPAPLLLQARLAARAGVGPEVVARRYTAGHTLLDNAIVAECAASADLNPRWLQLFLAEQGALLDRVLVAVSEEYRLEAGRGQQPGSRQDRLLARLLAGQPTDTSALSYEFEAWHIGVVASGPEVGSALTAFAQHLDRRPLLLTRGPESTWAWFGGRHRIGSDRLEQVVADHWPTEALLSIGEPGRGLPGWLLTNRQARAAAPLTKRDVRNVVRYAENALLASILQDDLFIASVRQLYLDPLAGDGDEGGDLRRTLEAYFDAQRNTSSAAAVLGVTRKTVSARLERVEERIGRPISSCCFEIEAALALDRVAVGDRPAPHLG